MPNIYYFYVISCLQIGVCSSVLCATKLVECVCIPSLGGTSDAFEWFGAKPARGGTHSDCSHRECLLRYHQDMLRVKRLEGGARLPVVAHPGEDLGYDVFAFEGLVLEPHQTVRLRTGIAVEARHPETGIPLGLLVRDRSSMAARGLATTAGVIDAGYRGEVLIVMTNLGSSAVEVKAGEKIAQMIPVPVLTGPVHEVETLQPSFREGKGFGSSGG